MQIIKGFQHKNDELLIKVEEKEQEIKLLVTVLCEIRRNYQEKLEKNKETGVKHNEAFFQSLTMSQIN